MWYWYILCIFGGAIFGFFICAILAIGSFSELQDENIRMKSHLHDLEKHYVHTQSRQADETN